MERRGKVGNDGFTLIELVMVILLIGILAAVVLPKFVNLTGSANKAASQGVVGSLGEGVTSQLSKNLVNNDLTTYVTVTGAQVIAFTGSATYPAANAAGTNPYTNPFLLLPNYTTPKTGTGSGTSYNIETTGAAPATPPGNSWWLDFKTGSLTGPGTAAVMSAGLICDNTAATNPNYLAPTTTVPENEYTQQIGEIDYVYTNGTTIDSYAYYVVVSKNNNIEGFYLVPCQS